MGRGRYEERDTRREIGEGDGKRETLGKGYEERDKMWGI